MTRISPIPGWRNQKQLYQLCGQKCAECKKLFYPKKYICSCGNNKFEEIKLSGKGKLLTFTQVHKSPELFTCATPYILGIIELEEGVRILSQIVDAKIQDLQIGLPVQSVFRKLFADGDAGVISYGVKFVLCTNAPTHYARNGF